MSKIPALLTLLGLLIGTPPTGARAETLRQPGAFPEVLEPRHRDAEQMAILLRPFLLPTGSLSIVNGKLMVKSTPENVSELRRVMAGLDRAPGRFRIQLRMKAPESADESYTWQTEARDGELALIRSKSSTLLVRTREVGSGLRMEILAPAQNQGEPPVFLAAVRGLEGRWLPAGAGFEIRATRQSSPAQSSSRRGNE
jgi:hypothetical protein